MNTRKRHVPRDSRRPLVVDSVLDIDESADVIPFNYTVTAYGADPQVDGLVKRVREGDIFIPLFSQAGETTDGIAYFQREYIWKKPQADRFIESLLLGLPVPGIFLVKEESGKHLVLDGHQRLQTLLRFFSNDWEGEPFLLESVQERFQGLTYSTLDPADKRRLDDSIMHATIVRQDEPSADHSSIYLIFERLNSGGTSLQPQEIRVALYHGRFVTLLTSLNDYSSWRILVGKRSPRLKDIELIVRFFALLETQAKYARPMKQFLNNYMATRRNIAPRVADEFTNIFARTCDAIVNAIGKKAFKPQAAVNAALVDALLVGLGRRIRESGPPSPTGLRSAYERLLRKPVFVNAISKATADEESVKQRLDLATRAFARVR